MNKIYTSYFAGIKKYNLEINSCISIALYNPKGLKIDVYPKLFPTKSILNDYKSGKITNSEYIKRYKNEVLYKLNPKYVSKELNDKILICYESPYGFCHRKIVSEWLNDSGYAIVNEIL